MTSSTTGDESNGDGGPDNGFDDDFFTDDAEKNKVDVPELSSKPKKGKLRSEESDKTFTYVPDAKSHQQAAQIDDLDRDETPFEAMQRKLADKRKARKAAKKLVKSGLDAEVAAEDAMKALSDKKGKRKGGKEEERAEATRAELELLLSDDDEDYDMRALHKQEKEVMKGPKAKRKR